MTSFNQQAGGELDADAVARRLNAVESLGLFLGAFAWLSLPAASSNGGKLAMVSDYGVNLMVFSDGVRWVPNGVQLIGRGAAPSSVTGTTAETTLATVTIPAGLLGVNGSLRVVSTLSLTNNANSKTLRIRYGGTPFITNFPSGSASSGTDATVSNRGAANSQVASFGSSAYSGGNATSSVSTGAVDSTANQDVTVTMQLGTGTDTVTLERYRVEVLP